MTQERKAEERLAMAAAGEEADAVAAGERKRVPFARGGPIFVPFLVGPLSSVPDFKSAALHELQSLEAELGTPGNEFDDELSVDELRVLTEEELVERALREAMEDGWDSVEESKPEEQGSDVRTCRMSGGKPPVNGTITSSSSVERDSSESPIASEDMAIVPSNSRGQKGKKRGRNFDRETRSAILQGSYLTKVEKLAEIKVKQDEDKRAARLHSFSGDSLLSKGSQSTSEKFELGRSLRYISLPWKAKAGKTHEQRPIFYPEVILCVEIYQKKYGSVKSQEFLVLGSQFLTGLRDNIYCLTDKLMDVPGQHDPSGYFLIEDTFYNDTRHCSAIDYSKPILDWLNNCSDEVAEKWEVITSGVLKKRQKDLLRDLNISNIPEFKSAKMQKIRFYDLRFRLGAGYLYCHQGNCKHMIVIRDMRLIHPEDTQNQAEYPLLTFQLRTRLQKCSVCQIYLATKMTVDDKWAPKNPCYFCIKCYFLLHYKEDNSLLYPHTVYDYYQE